MRKKSKSELPSRKEKGKIVLNRKNSTCKDLETDKSQLHFRNESIQAFSLQIVLLSMPGLT